MVFQVVGGIICSAKYFYLLHSQKISYRVVRTLELLAASIPYFFCGGRRQSLINTEVSFQFKMSPVIQWISDTILDGVSPCQEFLIRAAISGDQTFRDTVGTHGSPLIVIAVEPYFGQVIVASVFIDCSRTQVIMKIDDRQGCRGIVIKCFCCL